MRRAVSTLLRVAALYGLSAGLVYPVTLLYEGSPGGVLTVLLFGFLLHRGRVEIEPLLFVTNPEPGSPTRRRSQRHPRGVL